MSSQQTSLLSNEIFVLPVESGRYLAYAPLRRAAFVTNACTVNFLADLREGVLDEAADRQGELLEFLRRLEIVDGPPEIPPNSRFTGPPEPTTVSLFLTTACNLRCTYCYASAGDTPKKFMSLDVAKRGIDFVAANAVRLGVDRFEVAYHGGGEPSLNWQTKTASFDYARDKAKALGLTAETGAATNGVQNNSQIDWIMANIAGVSLSFDGLPEVNDAHRIMASGKGSSGRIMHTLRRVDSAGFRYGLRLTVTQEQIQRLPDSVEFICSRFKPVRIQVEPVYRVRRPRTNATANGPVSPLFPGMLRQMALCRRLLPQGPGI